MVDKYFIKTFKKVLRLSDTYQKYEYKKITDLDCEINRISAPIDTPEERLKFHTGVPITGWEKVKSGDKWGGDFCYAWIRCDLTITKDLVGKNLYIKSSIGEEESLFYINGIESGLFDVCSEVNQPPRLHKVQPISANAILNDKYHLEFECYSGHPFFGVFPFDDAEHCDHFYPCNTVRTFDSVSLVEYDKDINDFITLHRVITQLASTYEDSTVEGAESINIIKKIFILVPQMPNECSEQEWRNGIKSAVKIMQDFVNKPQIGNENNGYVGIIGHSHIDTAWQWPVRETLHKVARTFSNALRVMERYDNYKFLQSSVLYLDWMKKYYPNIFSKIKERVSEGRWEPNGGSWIECDNNIPGGEYIIRTFLKGQIFLKKELNFTADCFWQPDTFGYSAALPQIIRGCGMKYFLTTKLSWNETNKFPHDTFIWKGIDGSEVLTHFNITHCWPDVESVQKKAIDKIMHKDVTNMKLLAYGFGDGGGGPSYSMAECAEVVKKLNGIPTVEETTVSQFMKKLENTANDIPIFSGELYLELHRATLTQMHEIKKTNRLLEKAIHNLELINVKANYDINIKKSHEIEKQLKVLLLNQFHDILPGTCIEEAHKIAVFENKKGIQNVNNEIKSILIKDGEFLILYNSLSFDRTWQFTIEDNQIFKPDNCIVQRFTDLKGNNKMAIKTDMIKAMSVKKIASGNTVNRSSSFTFHNMLLITPFAKVKFDNNMGIVSYITNSGYEVVRDKNKPLNTIYMGEDIPYVWDNWDIDYDQKFKMKSQNLNVDYEVVSDGYLQFRIRTNRQIGKNSVLKQDIVFYSDSQRVDFETMVDWKDRHMMLKAGFDVNVKAVNARFETQFGNILRPTHDNYSTDKSQFEVCNHKWMDLSDNRFGVSILNDCKYGVSINESDIRLSLHRGGCRPDNRGDFGLHTFNYSMLVHEEGFNTESVIKPAYEFNYPIITYLGDTSLTLDESLFKINNVNAIIETVKFSEDKTGYVLRIYETEGSHCKCTVSSCMCMKKAEMTNMLEFFEQNLKINNNQIEFMLKPFEIKTIKIATK